MPRAPANASVRRARIGRRVDRFTGSLPSEFYSDNALETAPHAGGHEGAWRGMRLSMLRAVCPHTVSINVEELSPEEKTCQTAGSTLPCRTDRATFLVD